jgi:hypothetical protein
MLTRQGCLARGLWLSCLVDLLQLLCCCVLQEQLKAGEEIARCPSCSLYITVIYDQVRNYLCSALEACMMP